MMHARFFASSYRWLPYNVPEAAMQTKAVIKGDKWVINGRKQFITNGYDASLYVVYANTKPGVGMLQGTSCFLVPRDTPGLVVMRCNETMGGRYNNNAEIVFEDCAVPKDHLATPRVFCTWMRPSTSRASRSSRPCSPKPRGSTPGRNSKAKFENTARLENS